jgi:hypothetical protein
MQVVVQDQADQAESPGGVPLQMKAVMDSYGLQAMVYNVAVVVAQVQIALEVQVAVATEVFPAMVDQAQLIQDQVVVVVGLVQLVELVDRVL